jgi:hypothetical protein
LAQHSNFHVESQANNSNNLPVRAQNTEYICKNKGRVDAA